MNRPFAFSLLGPNRPQKAGAILAVASMLLAPTAHAEKIAIMPLKARRVDARLVATMDEVLVHQISQVTHHQVIGANEINALLEAEGMKDNLGCEDVSCAAEIGGALAAGLILAGSVGKLGQKWVINVTLFDTEKIEVHARAQVTIPAREAEVVSGLARVCAQLFRKTPPAAPVSTTEDDEGLGVGSLTGEQLPDSQGAGALGRRGTWSLTSDPPGARVLIDGEPKGTTPLQLDDLRPGIVRATLKKDGFKDQTLSVRISSGESVAKTVALVPLGVLSITTTPPGATVFLDDRAVGVTPFAEPLPDKTYRVSVEKKDHVVWQDRVNVRARGRVERVVSLETLADARGGAIWQRVLGWTVAIGGGGAALGSGIYLWTQDNGFGPLLTFVVTGPMIAAGIALLPDEPRAPRPGIHNRDQTEPRVSWSVLPVAGGGLANLAITF